MYVMRHNHFSGASKFICRPMLKMTEGTKGLLESCAQYMICGEVRICAVSYCRLDKIAPVLRMTYSNSFSCSKLWYLNFSLISICSKVLSYDRTTNHCLKEWWYNVLIHKCFTWLQRIKAIHGVMQGIYLCLYVPYVLCSVAMLFYDSKRNSIILVRIFDIHFPFLISINI